MGLATLTALALLLVPRAAASDAKTDVAGGTIDIASTLHKFDNPDWQAAIAPQLARRDEQNAQEAREETKRAEEEAAAQRAATVQPATASAVVNTGGHEDWMRAAGIPESEWPYVDWLVSRESGWNPNAVNRSSGACGLGQQLPCGKWPGAWNDPVAALTAMTSYVSARYGGWAQAVAFWQAHNWY